MLAMSPYRHETANVEKNVLKLLWTVQKGMLTKNVEWSPYKHNCIACSRDTFPERLRPFKHHFYSLPFGAAQNHSNTILHGMGL